MKNAMTSANFPTDAEGRVYHVSVKSGEVANRIVTVGDPERLRRFAKFLDPEPKPFELTSKRGYLTVTGKYKGVPVSLIAIGMGFSMMDFLVREVRAVTEGDLAIIRLGSCGSIDPSIHVGDMGVVRSASTITTNYDYFSGGEKTNPYFVSKPYSADLVLHDKLVNALKENIPSPSKVADIDLHGSTDFFYSTQGRQDANFVDDNATLVDDLQKQGFKSLEMESGQLFHLAKVANPSVGKIHAAATHIIFAGRVADVFIDPKVVEALEPAAGKACLDALVSFPVENVHPDAESVWA